MKAGTHAAGELGSNQPTQSGLTFHVYSEQWKKACWSSRLGKPLSWCLLGFDCSTDFLPDTEHLSAVDKSDILYATAHYRWAVVYTGLIVCCPFMEDTALKTQSNVLPFCSSGNHAAGRLGQHEGQSHIWEWFGMFYFSFGTRLSPHSVGSLVLRVILLSLQDRLWLHPPVHTIHSSPHSKAALWAASLRLAQSTHNDVCDVTYCQYNGFKILQYF